MATPPKKPVKRKNAEAIETEPDAWERFERTMDKVALPKRPKPKEEDKLSKKSGK